MNTEPTNESAYRGGELTQLRRERDLLKAENALLELQVAQLQHLLDQAEEPAVKPVWLREPWDDLTVLNATLLVGTSVCLGLLLGKLLQVLS